MHVLNAFWYHLLKMFSVKTNSWYFWMVTYYTSVASMGCLDSCNKSTLQASLGSVVLLSCSFGSMYLEKSPYRTWVVWSHGSNSSLVNITSFGQVDFLDSKQGRVKVFPNEGRLGNFSIRIDALQASDLGSYCCELHSKDQCHRVDLGEGFENTYLQVLFFSVGGAAGLIVLLSICFCLMKWTGVSCKNEDDYVNTSISSENNEHDPTKMQHDLTIIQHDQTRIQHDQTRIQQDPSRIQHGPTRIQHDQTRIQHDQTRIRHHPTRMQDDPNRIQHHPTGMQDDPTRIQHDPTRIQHHPNRMQDDPTRIQHDPTRIQHGPTRIQQDLPGIQQDPTRIQHHPTRMQDDPNRIQHHPTGMQDDPTRIQHDPTRIQHDPTRIQQDLTEIQHHQEPPRNRKKAVRFSNTPARDLSEKKKGFHTELMNILRQSSLGRHYYANQAEINQQARAQMDICQKANDAETNQEDRSQMDNTQRGHFQGKPNKDKCEYENPIYNKRIDHLNKR
ncbi:uncharacterized protein LOC105011264 isoform X2 [Esox lucius]|uniref:Immunoglobulin domain-containing protein n=1 Tax=Esox lucius TaxID=8010 RepID=A0A6Q2YS54_ESOLU|nr:uncharacterized protein LOC105011264 isoform X2 [Esox lucius]